MLRKFLLALTAAAAAAAQHLETIECDRATETTLNVQWTPMNATDLYYVSIASDAMSPPLALQTSEVPSITLIDLNPGVTYYLRVRSHPSEYDIVWGWRQSTTPAVACTTKAADRKRPHSLKRLGNAPQERSIAISWEVAIDAKALSSKQHEVGVRLLDTITREASQSGGWTWEAPSSAAALTYVRHGLAPGEWYEVVVRDAAGRVSEPLRARTAAIGALHTTAYRISEYTFDVDFLDNHDGANIGAIPAYVQNGGAMNETAIMGPNRTMDTCLAKLERTCPSERGESFACMVCANHHRAALLATCGNFSDRDSRQGWAVHFFCGIGWPGSSLQRSPITEYCVEHLPAPQTDPVPGGNGFAQYVSCNSDECDGVLLPRGNTPRAPTCICWVWDDRMISQEPKSRTLSVCSPHDKEPWVGANQCNCSIGRPGTDAALLPPAAPMANYVGRSRVYLPYYRYKEPRETYPVSVLIGDNLSFPRKGSCKEGERIGDGGCTWKRLPMSRMLYGHDLLDAGWNTEETWPAAGGTVAHELEATRANAAVFDAALQRIEAYVTKRCCGC